jgi:hypothetical protein
MTDGEFYLMRPALHGIYRLESLIDGSLDLEHVTMANDALDVKEENERRYQAMLERERQ